MAGSILRPKGHTWYSQEGGTVEHDTLQCCHCGIHWEIKPGSGIRRGFCVPCGKVTCGREQCDACLPMEKFIDCVERGIDPRNAPVKVHVPVDVPKAHLAGGIVLNVEEPPCP